MNKHTDYDRVLYYLHKNVMLNKHGLFSGYAYGLACPLTSKYRIVSLEYTLVEETLDVYFSKYTNRGNPDVCN